MLKSGVYPTVAGVTIALTVLARPKLSSGKLLHKLKSSIDSMQEKEEEVDVLIVLIRCKPHFLCFPVHVLYQGTFVDQLFSLAFRFGNPNSQFNSAVIA